ncbi:MAG: DNA recombination protein RmuC [Coprobacillus sp.]|nr:DNA recombination protein RmuC [Coprobacillus sp.]
MDTVSIVLISVLGALLLVVIIVLIIFLFRGRSKGGESSEVSNLSLRHDIEKSTTDQINNLSEKLTSQLNTIKEDLTKQNNDANKQNNEELHAFENKINESLNGQFEKMNEKVDSKLGENFKTTNETISKVNESLQKITDTQKNLDDMSKDVISLRTVLEGNQSRGAYGEIQLSNILRQYFHEPGEGTYLEQYIFKNGEDTVKADAVVFLPNDLFVCVDSKFPFADYSKLFDAEIDETEKEKEKQDLKREIKKHIDDISKKYIVDGLTFSQAIMFIPSDGIDAYLHYELTESLDYAYDKNVIVASPRVLGPLLTEIIMLKQEAKRNELAKELEGEISKLGTQFKNFDKEWSKLSNSIKRLSNDSDTLDKRARLMIKTFDNVKRSEIGYTEPPIENVIDDDDLEDLDLLDTDE